MSQAPELKKLVSTGSLVRDVRAARRSGNMGAMAAAMAAVNEAPDGIATQAARELITTLDSVEFEMVPLQIVTAMQHGRVAVGVEGELDLSGVETDELERVVAEVTAVAPSDGRCKLLLASAQCVLELRTLLLTGRWGDVDRALEDARRVALVPEAEAELACVRGLLRLRHLRKDLETVRVLARPID